MADDTYESILAKTRGRHAFIGLGFTDRGDSFDFNVTLQDHFKWVKQEGELAKQEADQSAAPKLDLGFKEGQTIKISLGNLKKKDVAGVKPRPVGAGGLLPPPPGGKSGGLVSHPPGSTHQTAAPTQQNTAAGSMSSVLSLEEENRVLQSELSRLEDLLAHSRADRDELAIKYSAISERVSRTVHTHTHTHTHTRGERNA
ncbi:Adaptin ear-binding coat-associated protein 1 [Bagarius yarrelli]|uniref:Adaptin ear-binding coat-associated protein 1 n=1 Tax=Bagarius yarrelli TaxID=175774 RepID=A0A556VVD7_BAGYA|nr:Adaptin ear-binding coat-associated protein 1 [Bagarius yarrelli]